MISMLFSQDHYDSLTTKDNEDDPIFNLVMKEEVSHEQHGKSTENSLPM